MTPHNLLVYNLQILVLIAACGLAIAALRLRNPNVRMLSMQAVLALCFLLPLLQPRLDVQARVAAETLGVYAATSATAGAPQFTLPPLSTMLLGLALLGAAGRVVWIGVGLVRLSRYRRHATPAPTVHQHLLRRVGVKASFFYSDEIPGPVTFGIFRPAILLPSACSTSEFVACHELVHVRRRDWAVALAEQFVLALFWFHPAVWWLVARLQLTREQVVDQEVVKILDGRDEYLNTLLSIAAARLAPDLAPGTLFLQKRHLRERVASLLQEVPPMSRIRLFSSSAALIATAGIVIFTCSRALPLQASPALDDSAYIEIQTGGANLLHRVPVEYPAAAQRDHIAGAVVAQLTLNSQGEVSDAKILTGPAELHAPVLASVLQWHFDNTAAPASPINVTVTFRDSGSPLLPASPSLWPAGVPVNKSLTLSRIDLSSVPPALRDRVSQAVTLHEGQTVSWQDMSALSASLAGIDEHLNLGVHASDEQSLSVRIGVPGYGPPRIRIGGNTQAANLIRKIVPLYPAEAKAARVQGVVKFTAEIGKDGAVQELHLDSGPPLLVPAAEEAVRQWVYRPTLLNGDPVDVVTSIDVNFTLSR
ncbi:MAG TPA: M56 family metallopeptidase [Bryobacteraceae bacterium]|jgi:beta-lactamase regulating signal transducer with metallopeptidase domain|nr:M56 family metallopeptidase [Bryobacteraceae bacterium]